MKHYLAFFLLMTVFVQVHSRSKLCKSVTKDFNSPDCDVQIMSENPVYWVKCCFKPNYEINKLKRRQHKTTEPSTTTDDATSSIAPDREDETTSQVAPKSSTATEEATEFTETVESDTTTNSNQE